MDIIGDADTLKWFNAWNIDMQTRKESIQWNRNGLIKLKENESYDEN